MKRESKDKPVVLVTGSAGLIGGRVVQALADSYTVFGLDVKKPEQSIAGTHWIHADLTDEQNFAKALSTVQEQSSGQIASVVHLAAYYDFSGEPSSMYEELTVQGTRRLIEGLRKFERVEQFIFSSSLLVMKPVAEEGVRLTEDSPTEAEWAYPQSKLRAEKVLRDEHGHVPVVILRLAGAYDEDCNSLPISQGIRRIYEKQMESYVFPGDPDHGQPFIHLDDVTSCIQATIESRSELDPWETFLIAEPEVLSHRQMQDQLGTLLHGKEWPTVRIPKKVAEAGARLKEHLPGGEDEFIKPWMIELADDHYPVDIRRARARLGWEPRHRLADTLPEMVARLRRDPERWYEAHNLPVPEELPSK